jgi:hypothetical protein
MRAPLPLPTLPPLNPSENNGELFRVRLIQGLIKMKESVGEYTELSNGLNPCVTKPLPFFRTTWLPELARVPSQCSA